MITINKNSVTNVVLFLKPTLSNPFYLFHFKLREPCVNHYEVLMNTSLCTDHQKFEIEANIPSGVYMVDIYEQSDYANLNINNASFLESNIIKVNFIAECQ